MSHKEVLHSEFNLSALTVNTNIQEIAPASAITIVPTPTAINGLKQIAISKDITSNDKPYSIFSAKQKVLVVVTTSISSFFSPLSANIYFPALKIIEDVST
jgi:hypothetical protein